MSQVLSTIAVESPAAQQKRLLERCDAALQRASQCGATEVEAYASSGRSSSASLQSDDLKLARVSRTESIGLRVLIGDRLGFAYSNQCTPGGLIDLVDSAMALARLSPPDPHQRLVAERDLGGFEHLVEAGLWHAPDERSIQGAADLLDRVRAMDPRIRIESGEFGVHSSSHVLLNSKGARAGESDCGVSCGVMGLAVDGSDVGGFDFRHTFVRREESLKPELVNCMARFKEAVLGNLGARKGQSYQGPVLLSPESLAAILIQPLCAGLSAISVQRGRSALAGKLGQVLAPEWIQLIDDPSDRNLQGAAAFDREGQPTRTETLLENGRLRRFLYNSYAARVEGRSDSAHASGSTRALPGIGVHALSLKPGQGGSRQDLLRHLNKGLLVGRFSGTVDPSSGDFSGVAKSARWVEQGEIQGSLVETLVAGNAFAAWRSILALSSQTECIGGSMRLPWALVDGISITAG